MRLELKAVRDGLRMEHVPNLLTPTPVLPLTATFAVPCSEICKSGLTASMTSQVQVEQSLLGWKEFEVRVAVPPHGEATAAGCVSGRAWHGVRGPDRAALPSYATAAC